MDYRQLYNYRNVLILIIPDMIIPLIISVIGTRPGGGGGGRAGREG
jgi:hypothetical protein